MSVQKLFDLSHFSPMQSKIINKLLEDDNYISALNTIEEFQAEGFAVSCSYDQRVIAGIAARQLLTMGMFRDSFTVIDKYNLTDIKSQAKSYFIEKLANICVGYTFENEGSVPTYEHAKETFDELNGLFDLGLEDEFDRRVTSVYVSQQLLVEQVNVSEHLVNLHDQLAGYVNSENYEAAGKLMPEITKVQKNLDELM